MVFLLTLPRVPTTAHKTWPRPISLNSFQLYALCSLGLIRSRPCCSLSIPNPLLSLCLLCMPENLLHQYLDSSLPHSILTSAQLSLLGELTCFLATQCLLLENVVSLLKFYCVHLFISWDGWASLWSFTWTLYQVDCLFLFYLVLFLEVYLILSPGAHSLVTSLCLILCVYLYVECRLVTPSDLAASVCLCAQSCLTLCHPVDWLPWTGSSVHGLSQARKLEWVANSYPRRSSQPRDQTYISCISCFGRWILYHWATWEALNLREVALGRCSVGSSTHCLLVTRTVCFRHTPYVGCMCPTVVAGLAAVSVLVGRAGPWHCWLPGFVRCKGCWPTGGQDWVLA